MARSRLTMNDDSLILMLTGPHHTLASDVGSATTRLSFGDRPVLAPERTASAPVLVSDEPFVLQRRLVVLAAPRVAHDLDGVELDVLRARKLVRARLRVRRLDVRRRRAAREALEELADVGNLVDRLGRSSRHWHYFFWFGGLRGVGGGCERYMERRRPVGGERRQSKAAQWLSSGQHADEVPPRALPRGGWRGLPNSLMHGASSNNNDSALAPAGAMWPRRILSLDRIYLPHQRSSFFALAAAGAGAAATLVLASHPFGERGDRCVGGDAKASGTWLRACWRCSV